MVDIYQNLLAFTDFRIKFLHSLNLKIERRNLSKFNFNDVARDTCYQNVIEYTMMGIGAELYGRPA